MGFLIARLQSQSFDVAGASRIQSALSQQHVAEIAVPLSESRRQLYGLPVARHRLVESSLSQVGVAEIVVRFHEVGAKFESPLKVSERGIELLPHPQGRRQVASI